MRSRHILKRPQVLADLAYHFHYIGLDSQKAALLFIDEVEKAFTRLSELPGMGRNGLRMIHGCKGFAIPAFRADFAIF